MARVPASTQRLVTPRMVREAVDALVKGADHNFAPSTDYDVLLPSGQRLPPKAVFGLALEKVIGEPATPYHFSAGYSEPSFEIIRAAGYQIVPKGQPPEWDEKSWEEGSRRARTHLERDRARGMVPAFKAEFRTKNGGLFCERCGVTAEKLGPYGDACMEAHHNNPPVSKMKPGHRTSFKDLMLICANCHRIVHREMAEAERAGQ